MSQSLPDFDNPPLIEVALSVQFDPLEQLRTPQIGLLWAEFRDRFPVTQEHVPLDITCECQHYRFFRQHFLYFFPLPHGHGSLRRTFSPRLMIGAAGPSNIGLRSRTGWGSSATGLKQDGENGSPLMLESSSQPTSSEMYHQFAVRHTCAVEAAGRGVSN